MPRNFARHEQFLRIFALLETLHAARSPLDDQSLIAALKDRLGLKQLSVRTLHRDCDFLASCGYPVDHVPAPMGRKQGWRLDREALASRKLPAEPLTMLELVAFTLARDLLQPFHGTVLWTGIESLRHKLEQSLTPMLRERLAAAQDVFHVAGDGDTPYATRPRLISTVSKVIADRREIDVVMGSETGPITLQRVQPLRLVIDPPRVHLLAVRSESTAEPPLLIDLDRIESVTPRDVSFSPRAIDVADAIAKARGRP